MNLVFQPHPVATLPIAGSDQRFPVRRIFCVGRNYADHAREMGALEQAGGRETPFFRQPIFIMKWKWSLLSARAEQMLRSTRQTA